LSSTGNLSFGVTILPLPSITTIAFKLAILLIAVGGMVVAVPSLLIIVVLVVDGVLIVVLGTAFFAQLTTSATTSKVGSIIFMLAACTKLCQDYFSLLSCTANHIKKASKARF
jgi:hypothetical protein